jgi:hypothetical protein
MHRNGRHEQFCRLWMGLITLTMIAGCSGGKSQVKLHRISGTLNRQGQPVPNFIVHFVPEKGGPSTGVSGPDGQFVLNYQQGRPGAVPGQHKVWVEYHPKTPAEEMELREGKTALPAELKDALQKYGAANTSNLKVQIDGDKRDLVISLD